MSNIYFEPEPGSAAANPTIAVPKGPLYMAAGIAAVAFFLAATSSWFGWFKDNLPPSPVVESRAYTFVDAIDGGILVYDAQGDRLVSRLGPDSFGFLRGSLRALARHRMLAGVGSEVPFFLLRYADGRLVLADSSTGEEVVFTSFGETQVGEFVRLFNPPPIDSAAVVIPVPADADPVTRPGTRVPTRGVPVP
jgi:putative photosynthetic complex assembly protein